MPSDFDPFALVGAVARLEHQQSAGSLSGSRCIIAIEMILRRDTSIRGSDVGPDRRPVRDSRSMIDAYLEQFGLLETIDCLASAPDVLGWDWKTVRGRFEAINRVLKEGGQVQSRSVDH